MSNYPVIPAGTLWQNLCDRSESALGTGSLEHIDTCEQVVSEGGIPFVVRIAKNLQRKIEDKHLNDVRSMEFNPFLPPETALTVGAIGSNHLAVLNKYNVVEHHLLIVTRHFEAQDVLLTLSDFEAFCWSLQEIDGFGFYNGGLIAGASQRHKHMQLIPLPLTPKQSGLPIEQVVPERLPESPEYTDSLPFTHLIAGLPTGLFDTPASAAHWCLDLYCKMLDELGIPPVQNNGLIYQSAPYNLLLTRRWLMVVPRTLECFNTISVNAMGFGGSLFVRNKEALDIVVRTGPLSILQAVSGVGGETA